MMGPPVDASGQILSHLTLSHSQPLITSHHHDCAPFPFHLIHTAAAARLFEELCVCVANNNKLLSVDTQLFIIVAIRNEL